MSAYLVTRDGQELGSFEATQIQEGLKTGFFQATDWGWREGMASWQGLAEIFVTGSAPLATIPAPQATTSAPQPTGIAPQAKAIAAPAISNPASAPVRQPTALKKTDALNPYAAPTANTQPSGGGVVPADVINELTGTKPWVRFISVLMWIVVAFMLLFVVLYLIIGLVGGSALIKAGAAGAGVALMIGVSLGLGVASLLIIYPTLKLSKYASNIGRLAESRSFADMAAALAEQRRFWKFQGILLIIQLSFALLSLLLMLAGVGVGAMSH
jgi:hypothetical protein